MKFDKTVNFDFGSGVKKESDGDGFYHAEGNDGYYDPKLGYVKNTFGYTYIYVKTPTWLDWSKEYDVEVECYATDRDGKKYGDGNETDGDYKGPVSIKLVYDPVKVILKPVTLYKKNKDMSPLKFNFGQELRFSSNGNRDRNDKVNDPKNFAVSSLYNGQTVRVFEITARGVAFDSTNTGAFGLSASKFTFYNTEKSKNEEALTDADIKNYFSQFAHNDFENNSGSNAAYIGFRANMSSTRFKSYMQKYEKNKDGRSDKPIEEKPNFVSVTFTASDKMGNVADTFYVTGEDYFNDSDIMNSRDYRFKIKYDSTKLNNEEYIEILK